MRPDLSSRGLAFRALPFDEQLRRIRSAKDDLPSLLSLATEAGALADPEPLGHLIGLVAAHDAPIDELSAVPDELAVLDELGAVLEGLPDPGLMHIFQETRGEATDGFLVELAERALRRLPVTRPSALAFLVRWLRRRAPETAMAFLQEAEEKSGTEGGRWLLFVSGRRLEALRNDPRLASSVEATMAEAVEALARAPKSISQANAEDLLARRVYADPGHFLFELLQNADDAGARRFEAVFHSDRAVICNDGAPFSFLDLVGVLSIGQTTKAVQQIGFFGVGFKSVYEVCERPRLHSGAFDVEIAHVSIPRQIQALSGRTTTTLVLPFKSGIDVARLYQRASAIPPETLLTLPHLESLSIANEASSLTWHEQSAGDLMVLESDAGHVRRYRLTERSLAFEGPREEGRPRDSRVLVVASVDDAGAPVPATGPTLFAFLPTGERTGLRFMVHARFDVTLDRERLELGSDWNTALLREAGLAFADLALELVAAEEAPIALMIDTEDASPAVGPLLDVIQETLEAAPCLRGADGRWVSPRQGRLLPKALAAALASLDLGVGARALGPLGAREERVARWLGARKFTASDLVTFLEGALRAGGPPPRWLGSAVFHGLEEVSDLHRLRALPILVDAEGVLRSAADAQLAPAAWARLYAGVRPVVATDELSKLPESLRERLALRPLSPSVLVEDLRSGSGVLEREPLLLPVLAELAESHLHLLTDALADIPLLRDRAGNRRPVRELYRGSPSMLAQLPRLPLEDVHVVDPRVVEAYPELIERWLAPFGLPELANALDRTVLALDRESAAAVVTLVEEELETLALPVLQRFARHPLFEDMHGVLRPLEGESRALVGERTLREALPSWPWLRDLERSFVRTLRPPRTGGLELVAILIGDAVAPGELDLASILPWLSDRGAEVPGALADRLADAPIWLDREGRSRRLGELRRGAGSGASTTAIDDYYRSVAGRSVASDSSRRLAEALRLGHHLPRTDHAAVVADLLRGAVPGDRDLLAAVLNEAASLLPSGDLRPVLGLPLFRDESDAPCTIADWGEADWGEAEWGEAEWGQAEWGQTDQKPVAYRAGPFRTFFAGASVAIVSEEDEARFSALFQATGPAPARIADLIRVAAPAHADADGFLEVVVDRAAELGEAERARLGELAVWEARSGERQASSALASSAPFSVLLKKGWVGPDLDGCLLSDKAERITEVLGTPTADPEALFRDRIVARLLVGESRASQPTPWTTNEALWALAEVARRLSIPPASLPLAVDFEGRLGIGLRFDATPAAQRLVAGLPQDALRKRLADPAWAEGSVAELLEPLPARRLAEALRVACPEEAPIDGHPVLQDVDSLFAWIREEVDALSAEDAKPSFAAAAVLPSQKGTFRAARDLVLDPTIPDLGLDWGLSAEVPRDIARWLADTFELDRNARQAIVDHLLDGLDAAASDQDEERAASLLAFLAHALGAGRSSLEGLEQRVRRSKVRARLKVPVDSVHGQVEWVKPRFAWTASDERSATADTFVAELPPRIRLPAASGELDRPLRDLLRACGARSDLDDATVRALLDGTGLRPGPEARIALARYVAARASETPARIERWRLQQRAWVPDQTGVLRRPRELLYPDELAENLFGDDPTRFADVAMRFDLSDDAAGRLGLRRAALLSLRDVSEVLDGRLAELALVDWLEDGLREGRFAPVEVRRSLRDKLLLPDEDGVGRPVAHLAQTDARRLFGSLRGNFADSLDRPNLVRAFAIPRSPDASMIVAFLEETGEALSAMDHLRRAELTLRLPDCYERLSELAERDRGIALPRGGSVAAFRNGRAELGRLGHPSLRMLEPESLAAELPESIADGLLDPLPSFRSAALRRMLWGAGVADLWTSYQPTTVIPGPRRDDLGAEAEALFSKLRPALGESLGSEVKIVDGIRVEGRLELQSDTDYRTSPALELPSEAAAIVHDQTLWLTPATLADPTLLGPALARDPVRRAAIVRWLEAGEWDRAPKKARTKKELPKATRSKGWWSRIKDALSLDDERGPGSKSRSRDRTNDRADDKPKSKSRRSKPIRPGSVGDNYFRPQNDLGQQLEHGGNFSEDRLLVPDYGFAFSPARLPSPWLYAPKLIASRFERRGQRWRPAKLRRPNVSGEAGVVAMRGRLPQGDALLPLPLYGRVDEVRIDEGTASTASGPSGGTVLRLDRGGDVRLTITLGAVPDLELALPAEDDGSSSFVPDRELPEEVHDFLADLDPTDAPIHRAVAIRDFVRRRYRYDPAYLEDAAVGRWLAKISRGRANVHVAALHAGGDARHLGAGVCYELNTLVCELLRRGGIPSAIATGWVLEDGSIADPDHLWAIALLADPLGEPVWVPVDASTTETGRPLRVPRRPAGRFRKPREKAGRAPPRTPPRDRWKLEGASPRRGARGGRGSPASGARSAGSAAKTKKRTPPKAELRRLVRYLERVGGRSVDARELRELEALLEDRRSAAALLERILK
ncbi:MAG: transglutaminase domain-containing protein [Myxococcota bacterium]